MNIETDFSRRSAQYFLVFRSEAVAGEPIPFDVAETFLNRNLLPLPYTK